MTRRLVAAILGTVLGALLVAGALTVVIARWQAEESTEDVLRQQVESLAFAGAAVDPLPHPASRRSLGACSGTSAKRCVSTASSSLPSTRLVG